MKKTIAVFIALVTLIFSSSIASAAELQPYASLTLSRHYAEAFSADKSGEIIIEYNVEATKPSSTLGVETIDFYTEDGDHVASVTGTTSNGLVRVSTTVHNSDFHYNLPSGNHYYAEVTVFARVGSEYDSRTITTSTVWVS